MNKLKRISISAEDKEKEVLNIMNDNLYHPETEIGILKTFSEEDCEVEINGRDYICKFENLSLIPDGYDINDKKETKLREEDED